MRLICTLSLMLAVAACRSLTGTGEDLQRSVLEYNRLLRWQEGSEAVTRFVQPLRQPDYQLHTEGGRAPRIVDYRVGTVIWRTPGSVAVVPVEVRYYLSHSATVKTISDNQEWHYTEGQGWQITSPPPEFP
jgi:hypothetical protein